MLGCQIQHSVYLERNFCYNGVVRILIIGAEVAPFVSVGGLSQVLYFLPRALLHRGNDVRIFTAAYGAMKEKNKFNLKPYIKNLQVPTRNNFKGKIVKDSKFINCRISLYEKRGTPTTYFLENREYFDLRANVFSYRDDHLRFALLSKAALEWLYQMKKNKMDGTWWPDVIHCNDWHTGYFLNLAREDKKYKKLLEKIPIVFTVHNFFYQGNMNFRYAAEKEKDNGNAPLASLESGKLLKQNALLRGLLYADEINTVSPTHAIEILTPEYSEGLDKILFGLRGKLTGILNGLDTKEFNPETDPLVVENYNAASFIAARRTNKMALQKEFGLEENKNRPLVTVLGRISTQKGWDFILEALPKLLSEIPDVQVLVLGQGDERYQNELLNVQREFPKQVALHLQNDFRLPRRIYSGADIILIPSIFEPGGIVALEALRYGVVPVVRRTGGLNDIIMDFDADTGKGNGFSFTRKSSWSLFAAIISALSIYKQGKIWNQLVKNCLVSDFSWNHAAAEYDKLYQQAIEEKKRATSTTPHPAYKLGLPETPTSL